MTHVFKLIVGAALVSTVAACATDNSNRQAVGTVIGAIAGAVIGHQVDSEEGKYVGAAIGAVAGNQIGRMLDERERAELQRKKREALEYARVGETITWKSSRTDASAEITPVNETVKEVSVPLELSKVSGRRVTSANLNVRAGPSTSFEVEHVLRAGTPVSLESAADNGWYRIERDGRILGFVNGEYLVKEGEEGAVSVGHRDQERSQGGSRGTPEGEWSGRPYTEEINLRIATECRTVRVRVYKNGKVSEEREQTCRAPDGSWGA